jgi:EAL domain-containing protein (putative c-di-GMP-specific phosphodiesterase class I)
LVLGQPGYRLPDEILRDADIAMYRAKSSGKARYEIFDPTMRERLITRLRMETELRQALEQEALSVYYQPVLSVSEHTILGCEALARWKHAQRGMISPKEFIPIAEEAGIITNLDMWVLRQACQQTREWQKTIPGAAELTISVNFSGKHFTHIDLVDQIKQVLKETDMDPHYLNLEITENVVMENYALAAELLGELQALGVQIQVDDFGMGYSSLGYLSRFPINALKIDQSFVSNMQQDSTNMKIIQAIISMTHSLGMKVIAEGVETPAQLKRLEALGCEFVQGYLVAMPLSSQQMYDLLQRAFASPLETSKEKEP